MQILLSDALRISGVRSKDWEQMVTEGVFPALPPPFRPGTPRPLTINEVCALFVADHLHRLGVSVRRTGLIVGEALAALNADSDARLENLWVVSRDGHPFGVAITRPPPGVAGLEFPICVIRGLIEGFVRAKGGAVPS